MRAANSGASRGRLFRLQLERSRAAREDALATVRESPGGWWVARVGGRVRGRMIARSSRARIVAAVNEHYNAALFQVIARARDRSRYHA